MVDSKDRLMEPSKPNRFGNQGGIREYLGKSAKSCTKSRQRSALTAQQGRLKPESGLRALRAPATGSRRHWTVFIGLSSLSLLVEFQS